jgi:hypothetical protein
VRNANKINLEEWDPVNVMAVRFVCHSRSKD